MGLATLDLMKWQVPWDLPLLNSQSGKSHGTCHFRSYEVASPVGLATFEIQKWPDTWDLPYHMLFDIFKMRNGKSPSSWVWFLEVASPKGLAIFRVKKWQVPWQVPFLNYPFYLVKRSGLKWLETTSNTNTCDAAFLQQQQQRGLCGLPRLRGWRIVSLLPAGRQSRYQPILLND